MESYRKVFFCAGATPLTAFFWVSFGLNGWWRELT